jgi:hypothetical protein
VKNTDPTLKRLNKSSKFLGIGLALALIGLTLAFIASRLGPSKDSLPTGFYILEFCLLLSMALLSLASFTLTRRFYKKAGLQRIAAIQDNIPGKIAEQQPVSNALILTLPVTLAVRVNWRFLLAFMLLPFCLTLVLGSLALYYFFFRDFLLLHSRDASLLFAIISVAALFVLIVIGIAILLFIRKLRQYIQVSESGIQSRFLGQESSLRWDEIQLFALWGGKSKSMHAYEIVGTNGLVRWTAPIKKRWYNSLVPTQPFEEYDKQMQAVLALIVTKTQLPLYDLRLKWWGGTPKE